MLDNDRTYDLNAFTIALHLHCDYIASVAIDRDLRYLPIAAGAARSPAGGSLSLANSKLGK